MSCCFLLYRSGWRAVVSHGLNVDIDGRLNVLNHNVIKRASDFLISIRLGMGGKTSSMVALGMKRINGLEGKE